MDSAPPCGGRGKRARKPRRASPTLQQEADAWLEELEADTEADMADEQDERRGRAQRWRNRMAGRGPDGEGLGWRD